MPGGLSSPRTASLAELLDEAARQASSLTRSCNAPCDKHCDTHCDKHCDKAASIRSGGAGSSDADGGGSGGDDSTSGSDGGDGDGGGGGARLSGTEDGAQQSEARRAEQSEQLRLELALADLSRHERQGQRGDCELEVHEQLAELQLAVVRLHEEQRALISAHRERERQQEFTEVQACACTIS